MPINKAPGPDDFLVEFYKDFWTLLTHYVIIVTQIKEIQLLSSHLNTANFNLLKPGEAPTLPASYRPVCLINDDLKRKTLAKRLEPVTPNINRVH